MRVLIRIEGWPRMRIGFTFEPAAWLGLARVAIYTAGVFGVWGVDQWTDAQKVAAISFCEAVCGWIQRSFVTPNVKLD